jgi:hypothetical protein
MKHHDLFLTLAAVILVGAVMIAAVAGWLRATPFILFSLATVMRGSSIRRNHIGTRNAAYALFAVAVAVLTLTMIQG